jgi:hypothetical protein
MSTLALTSNTLAVTAGAGQIEYDGQFFATDSNASRGQLERITQGTAVASTSGTSIDFTGIPAWAKKITVMLNGASTNGSSNLQIQIGSGSFTTSGYLGGVQVTASSLAYTTGFGISFNHVNTANLYGVYCIQLLTGNTWVYSGMNYRSNDNGVTIGTGSLALGGTLDRVRITTVNGTDTFDAGSINIMYEG